MVYVDKLRNSRWRYGKPCHMTADSKDELVALSAEIGLKAGWLQKSRKGVWHFDLNEKMRNKALAAGVKEIDVREMVRSVFKKRVMSEMA